MNRYNFKEIMISSSNNKIVFMENKYKLKKYQLKSNKIYNKNNKIVGIH